MANNVILSIVNTESLKFTYFFLISANSADGRRFIPPTYGQGLPPSASAHLPPHTLGIPTEPTYPPHAPPPHQANVAVAANVGAVVDPNDHHRMAMMVSVFQSY